MAAYVIAEIEVTDAAGYEESRRRVPATVARINAIARTGIPEVNAMTEGFLQRE